MAPERWRQIEELYHSARERGSEALAGADPELRAEVERLLAQDSDGKILDRPAADVVQDSTLTITAPDMHTSAPASSARHAPFLP